MAEIRVPKLNNNDSAYTLLEWLVADGQEVGATTPVVTLETSKAVEELESGTEGVLRRVALAGQECVPGEVIGQVIDPAAGPVPPAAVRERDHSGDLVITAPAQALIDALGLDSRAVRDLDVKVVRRADVERLAAGRAAPAYELPAVQRAVARTVETSHRTIPAAYTVIQVEAGPALAAAAELAARLRRLVGLTEFLVCAVARLHSRFPGIFATPADDTTLRPSTAAQVGVTIDVGRGLHVPVIANASELSLEEIVAAMTRIRETAISGTFREHDLAGANIAVALHHDRDIVLAVPFVFPGQLCTLALAGLREEARLGPAGALSSRTLVNVGLAYDHRFVNGRDAIVFLRAVKDLLETPGELVMTQPPDQMDMPPSTGRTTPVT